MRWRQCKELHRGGGEARPRGNARGCSGARRSGLAPTGGAPMAIARRTSTQQHTHGPCSAQKRQTVTCMRVGWQEATDSGGDACKRAGSRVSEQAP